MTRERPPSIMAQHRRHRRAGTPDRRPVPVPSSYGVASDQLAALLGITLEPSRTLVDERNVQGLAAVQSGVDMVAHAVAAMMAEAECFDRDGNPIEAPDIVRRPCALFGPFEYWTALVDMLMKRGNAPGVLADFDERGVPRQAVPVHPAAVSMDDSTGIPWYTIGDVQYAWDQILHPRHGAPWGSLWGQGIVERYRNALQRQLAEQEYGRSSMMSGGIPSAHVQLDKSTVTDAEAEAIDDRWQERFGGGVRKPVVTGKALKVEVLSWSPEDAEYCESRRMSVGEAALICGLHPADLGATLGGTMDYANLTDRQLSRVLQSFAPWLRIVEETWSDLIPDGGYVRGSVEALLRTSTAERYETYKLGREIGVWTDDEIREAERRPKRTDDDEPAPVPPEEVDE